MNDLPTWWAVLFGLGGIAVIVLALILMRQKANQAEAWKQDPQNPGPRPARTDDAGPDGPSDAGSDSPGTDDGPESSGSGDDDPGTNSGAP